jgi:hypothetical protein
MDVKCTKCDAIYSVNRNVPVNMKCYCSSKKFKEC